MPQLVGVPGSYPGGVTNTITTMKNRGATPRCFNRVPKGKKDA